VTTAVHLAATRRVTRPWIRVAVAGGTLALLVWRLGAGPFLDGLRTIDGGALAAAFGLAVVTTLCCAWRWRLVAGGLGIELPMRTAVAAYYRSLFLNVTLPGGVVGDVHRGVSHGLRAVVYERAAGQVVQITLTVAVLLVAPSPVHDAMPLVALGLFVVAAVAAVVWRPTVIAWPAVGLASALVVAGHAGTFLLAAHTVGTTAPLTTLIPLALLVLAAGALPNIGGWGPREGVTAWAFGAAGLGASHGLATSVVYGVMVLVATLPGAAALLLARRHA
jgi:glycosyltransferase 2 family protein